MADDSNSDNIHETVQKDIAVTYDRVTMNVTYQGDWDDILAKASKYRIGQNEGFEDEDVEDIDKVKPTEWQANVNIKCTDCRITRMNGGRGQLTATIVALRDLSIWTLDFSEVSKDIHTWMADATKEGDNGSQERDDDKCPDLAVISAWERLKDSTEDVEMYKNLQYYDSSTNVKEIESGTNTYKLAQMILNGIESYTIYIPVLTRTSTSFTYEDLRSQNTEFNLGVNFGKNLLDKCGLSYCDGLGAIDNLLNDAGVYYNSKGDEVERQWFKTADTISCNGDGSFTRTERWSGVDKVNENLYKVLE